MFDNSEARNAERLGEIWDEVTLSGSAGESRRNGDDAALANYLKQLTPTLNDTTRERMRARVLASQRGEARFMSQAIQLDSSALSAPLPQQPRSFRAKQLEHPFMRIAALILLGLAIGGTWLGIRSFGPSDDPTPTPLQGAFVATPEPDTEEVGFRETVLLHNVAAVGELRQFTATISRVTLPPGSTFDFSGASLTLDAEPVSFYVESGTLTIVQNGVISSIGPGEMSNAGVPSALRVESPMPVQFIMLTLRGDGDVLPVAPDGATVETLGEVPIKQPLGSVTTINLSRSFWNMPGSDPISASDNETIAFVAVNSGSMTVTAPAGDEIKVQAGGDRAVMFGATTGEPITLNAGDTITADTGSAIDGHASLSGSDMLSAYVLTVLQQSPQDIAEQQLADGASTNWTIPDGAETAGMLVRSIVLQPGAEWSYGFDGVVQYQNFSGEVSVSFDTNDPTQLTAGQYAAQSGSGKVVIRNTGSTVATVLQASLAIGAIPEDSLGATLPEGVSTVLFSAGQTPVSPGEVTVRLGTSSFDNGSTQSTDSELGASLITVTEGNAIITSRTGDVVIESVHPADQNEATPTVATTTPTILLEGDSAMIPQGASYSITGATEHVARVLWFWFEPAQGTATPVPGN